MKALQKWLQNHPDVRLHVIFQNGRYWATAMRDIPYIKTDANGDNLSQALQLVMEGFEGGEKVRNRIEQIG